MSRLCITSPKLLATSAQHCPPMNINNRFETTVDSPQSMTKCRKRKTKTKAIKTVTFACKGKSTETKEIMYVKHLMNCKANTNGAL